MPHCVFNNGILSSQQISTSTFKGNCHAASVLASQDEQHSALLTGRGAAAAVVAFAVQLAGGSASRQQCGAKRSRCSGVSSRHPQDAGQQWRAGALLAGAAVKPGQTMLHRMLLSPSLSLCHLREHVRCAMGEAVACTHAWH
jgi:hypothetical protein